MMLSGYGSKKFPLTAQQYRLESKESITSRFPRFFPGLGRSVSCELTGRPFACANPNFFFSWKCCIAGDLAVILA